MSFTAETAALSDRYSWKNFSTFPNVASAARTAKISAIAQTGRGETCAARLRPAARYAGSGGRGIDTSSVLCLAVRWPRNLVVAGSAREPNTYAADLLGSERRSPLRSPAALAG